MRALLLVRCPVCHARRDRACRGFAGGDRIDPTFTHHERQARFEAIVAKGPCGVCGVRLVTLRRCPRGHVHLLCEQCLAVVGEFSRNTIERCVNDDATKAMVVLARQDPES